MHGAKEGMTRLKLTVAYRGAGFAGWQIQPGQRTVQAEVQAVLRRLCGVPVVVHSAARTDSGVHALGQVAHCDVPGARAGIAWRKSLNSLLPDDACVTAVEAVRPDFHARYDAVAKIYAYTLWTEREYVLPQRRDYVWRHAGLDLAAMDAAALAFVGTHDFSAFQNVGTPLKSTVRTVSALWRAPGITPQEVVWRIRADGFLKQMVRNIVGCLVAVGRGRLDPGAVAGLLAGGDRNLAPETAPPQGLCLEQVEY